MIIVLGFFRSGTSALCRMLSHCGVNFGKGLIPGKDFNPLGYYEHHLLNELNSMMGHGFHLDTPEPRADVMDMVKALLEARGVDAIKDPRICRLVKPYCQIIDNPKFILIERDEEACVRSFDEFTMGFYGKDHARKLRAQYQDMAVMDTKYQPRVMVRYEDLLDDWRSVAEQINELVPLTIGEEGGIDRTLNRHG